jgi:hypothetical protein
LKKPEMTARRLVPLTGVVAVALVVVAFVVGGETPDTDDPVEEIVSFYTENDSDQKVSGLLLGLGMFFFLCFATVLRENLRRAEAERGAASTLGFAGAIVFAIGALIFAGLGFTLGEAADDIDPTAIQTLHVLNNEMFLPLVVGILVFFLGSGIAVLKTGALPKWIGWVAIIGAILSLTPTFLAAIVLGLFILLVSVLLSLRSEVPPAPRAGPPPSA